MNFAATIANLRTELKTKNEDLATLAAELEQRPTAARVTELSEQVTTLGATITDLQGQITTLSAENADLKGKLTTAETNVAGQVIDRISAAGVPAIARVDSAATNTPAGDQGESGKTGLARAAAAFSAQTKK